jgi:hypothetical protein
MLSNQTKKSWLAVVDALFAQGFDHVPRALLVSARLQKKKATFRWLSLL